MRFHTTMPMVMSVSTPMPIHFMYFTQAAHTVFEQTGDKAAQIPEGFEGGALDFASSLFGWVIYKCVAYLKWVGAAVLTVVTIGMVIWNRMRIAKEEKNNK